MDTSKEYIKMCDCPEIQDNWNPRDGDFIYDSKSTNENDVCVLSYHDCCSGDYCKDPIWNYELNNLIWLPRQDQLQEMAKGATPVSKLLFFYDFIDEVINGYTRGRIYEEQTEVIEKYSLEQLWLISIMKEKFNKTWNGEWI